MKVIFTQNRNAFCVHLKEGFSTWLYASGTEKEMRQLALSLRLEHNDCKAADFADISRRVRVAYYTDDLACVQHLKGFIFKRWVTVHFCRHVGRHKGNSGADNCAFEGYVMSKDRAFEFANLYALEIKDKEVAEVLQ